MNTFLNHMLSKGAILGMVMLVSHIAEQLMMIYGGTSVWTTVAGIEMLVSLVVFIWLLRNFTKSYAALVLAARKDMPYFSYMNGLNYAISVSMLAGVIVGLGGYILHHFVIGHEAYIAGYMKMMQNALATTQIPASMVSTYEQLFAQIKNMPESSLLTMVFNSAWNYLLLGLIVGLFVAKSTKRDVQLFDKKQDDDE